MKNGQYLELTQRFKVVDDNYNLSEVIVENGDGEKMLLGKTIQVSVLGEYKSEVEFKTRTELIKEFEKQLPFMRNRLVQLNYYKTPDYKSLYKKHFGSQSEFEKAMKYGEYREMKGEFCFDGLIVKERHGYELMKDIEDNGVEKPVVIKNMVSFIFDGTKYYINE